jgi:hypothetical protein
MTDVVIRQSGKRRSGAILALIILAVLMFAKYGPEIGQVQNEIEREEFERKRTATIFQGKDIKNLKKAFEGPDNAAAKFLELLPNRADDGDPAPRGD